VAAAEQTAGGVHTSQGAGSDGDDVGPASPRTTTDATEDNGAGHTQTSNVTGGSDVAQEGAQESTGASGDGGVVVHDEWLREQEQQVDELFEKEVAALLPTQVCFWLWPCFSDCAPPVGAVGIAIVVDAYILSHLGSSCAPVCSGG
jgi:hypothetical protein